MKKNFYLTVFLALCAALLLTSPASARALQGDADGNGKVQSEYF